MRPLGTIPAAALLLLLPGCGPTGLTVSPPHVEENTELGPGDVFEVRVYGEEDLSSNYRVAPNGTIDYPYIGEIRIQGMEPPAVAALIEERLREADVLRQPQITVFVTEYASRRFNISGAVRNPGIYPVNPGLTVLQAIGVAGGTTDLANRDGTIVTRRVDGELRRYAAPIDQITVGESEDFEVRSQDIIYVPERPL